MKIYMIKQKPWLTLSSPWVLGTLLALPGTAVQAQMFVDEEEDPYELTPLVTQRINQFNNEVEFVVRNRDNDAVKFGEYNSLESQGLGIDGSILIDNRDYEGGSARFYRLWGDNLGTEARELEVEGGKQGDYRLRFNYENMERQVWDDFNTPYRSANGGADLVLPVADPTPGDKDVTYLAPFITSQKLEMDRERVGLGGQKSLDQWTFDADFSRETKKGAKDYGLYASGGSQPVIFALPIDYTTDTLNLSMEYAAERYHVRLGYEVSSFDNELESTTLDNPYNDGHDRIAQEPDNLYQVLSVNGNMRFTPDTRGTWFLAYSKAEQDEDLLDQSVNGAPVPAGRATAEARMDKVIARLGITSRITRSLSLNAKYDYQDDDHKTDLYSATYLAWDNGFPRPEATTPEFDTTRESIALSADYRLPNRSKLRGGFEREEIERPDQDREETRENTYWASWKSPMMSGLNTSLKYSYADRDGSSNNADAISAIVKGDPTTDQHPEGAVRFMVADRIQNKVQANATYALSARASLGAMVQLWEDDYTETEVGLRQVDGELYTLDLSLRPSRRYGVSVYTGLQRFEYDQRSQARNFVWHQTTEDSSWVAGLNLDWEAMPNKLLMKFGYRYTDTQGEIDQVREDGGVVNPLPDIESRIHTYQLSGEYFVDKQTTLIARAAYEDYESSNWAFDNLGAIVDTGDGTNFLGGGMDSPNHHAALVELGLRYQF